MRKWHRSIAAIVAVMLGTVAFAEDWPQWRGPNRDGKVTGFTPPATWPKALAQKWKITVGDGDATPALVGDKLFVFTRQGTDEVLSCLNAADGNEIWKKSYPATATVTGPAQQHPGPRSSPAVADGKVVTLGVAGILTCWDASNGNILWKKTEIKGTPGFFTASSPLIVDGLVIAQLGGRGAGMMGGGGGGGRRGGPGGGPGGPGGGRGTPPPIQQERPAAGGPPGDRQAGNAGAGGGAGEIMAFELATGNEKWKWTGESPSYSSPIVATIADVKQIIAPTEKSIVSVSLADGKLLWQVPSQAQRMTYNAPTPIVDGDNVIITGYGGGTRAMKIAKQGDVFSASEAWNNNELGTTFNTPVLKDGYLYGLSSQGNLFCINARDGKTAWTGPQMGGGGGMRRGGGANFGAIVDAGSVLIALPSSSERSELIVFKPNEKAYEEVAKVKVSESQTFAYPVLTGNKVIVKDQQSVAMLAIE